MTRIERLMAEVLLLQERGRTCEEMARALEVSRRTVIRDVQSLCEMGVPVMSRDGIGGGYSLMEHYGIAPLQLTWQEALLMIMALDGLSKLSDSPFSAERSTLTAKLRSLIPDKHRPRLDELRSAVALGISGKRPRAPMLDRLVEVVGSGAWVSLEYDGTEGVVTRIVRPDKLYADRGLWYLHGIDGAGVRTLRVDRIRQVDPADPPEEVTAPLPYDHPSHPVVRVRLTRRGARIVQRDPHMGHYADADADGQILEFRCPPSELDWYANYFGGMGSDAIVFEPEALRSKIRARAEHLLVIYSGDESA